jgi:NO-binding membrane sensor protein with MHYT domain/nitrogen-specific signal transduction histidine kinase/CheY-like chemotaxis protein
VDFSRFFTFGLDTSQALVASYDADLVIASYLISALAGFAFLRFTSRIIELGSSVVRFAWMAAGALTMGLGVWAMHFIGMLAYRLPIPVGFDAAVTALSALPAVLGSAVALFVVGRPAVTMARLLLGGTFMGAGIGAMHYTGMAAIRFDAFVSYDPLLFATSVVVAVALAFVALFSTLWSVRQEGSAPSLFREGVGAAFMGLAVSGMHYTAMTSAFCFAQPVMGHRVLALDHEVFAAVTTTVAAIVLLMAIAGIIFERRLSLEIARRQQAAERARVIDQRMRDAIETMPDGLALFDRDAKLVLWNSRYAGDELTQELLKPGAKYADLVRHRIEAQWPDAPPERKEKMIAERLEQFRNPAAPMTTQRSDGRWFFVRTRSTADGGAVMVRTDITPLKQAEEKLRHSEQQLQQAQKMEAIGQLTGGIAHDFNNLLGIIIGNLDLYTESADGAREGLPLIEAALDAALRGADLNQRLLAFARRQSLQPERVNPTEVLEGMINLLNRAVGERIVVRMKHGDAIWPIKVDLAQLESAIVNLAVNARDAMTDGGTLTIETTNVTIDKDDVENHLGAKNGDYVCIAVSDTGTGMTADVQARAFEPFFTTKPTGRGSGLGLSMVFGFVKQSDGHVNIYSETGLGTVLRLYLPRASGEAVGERPSVERTPASLPTGSEIVLVVEDNEAMGEVAAKQLKDLGYKVIGARNAMEALTILDNGTQIDLLFTDVIMPGALDGIALTHEARKRRPKLKVLLTSGFTNRASEPTMPESEIQLPARLLTKPYRKHHLAESIRQALDE